MERLDSIERGFTIDCDGGRLTDTGFDVTVSRDAAFFPPVNLLPSRDLSSCFSLAIRIRVVPLTKVQHIGSTSFGWLRIR